MSDMPTNKQEALVIMAREREALEKTFAGLSDAQMTQPRKDGWSIKDHLMHIAVWEQGVVALLNKQPRYTAMGLTRDEWLNKNGEEKNTLIYIRTKDRSLADVRAAFRDSHQQMLKLLDRLTDEDLEKPYSYHAPDTPYAPDAPSDDERPVYGWVAGNTFGHYAEHRGWIQEMLDKTKG